MKAREMPFARIDKTAEVSNGIFTLDPKDL
jgi:hypothetical protein